MVARATAGARARCVTSQRGVERFLRLRSTRPAESWHDTLRAFLEDLGNGRTLSWQLRQAGDAVTLYCGQFCEAQVTRTTPVKHVLTRHMMGHEALDVTHSATGPAFAERGDLGSDLTSSEMLTEMSRLMRLRHYARRTERTYLDWVLRFLEYVGQSSRAPSPEDVQAFLSHLAIRRKVASSTQNQAFSAVLFLFRNVLMVDLGNLGATVRARQGRRLPVVLSLEETRAVFAEVDGLHRLMLELIYGGGLRVS